MRYPFSINKYC